MLDVAVPNTTFRDWVHYAGRDQGPVMLVCSWDWSLVSYHPLFRLHSETACYQQESPTRCVIAIGVTAPLYLYVPASELSEIDSPFSTVSDLVVSKAPQSQVTAPDGVNIGVPCWVNIGALTPYRLNIATPCWVNLSAHCGYHTTTLTQVNNMAHSLPACHRVIIPARYRVIMPACHQVIMPARHWVIIPAHH